MSRLFVKTTFFVLFSLLLSFFIGIHVSRGHSYFTIALFCSLTLICFLIHNYALSKTIISFSSFFAVVLFVFNFGQIVLLGFFPNSLENKEITLLYFKQEEIISSMQIMYYAFFSLLFGLLLFSLRETRTITRIVDYDLFRKKALLFIAVTFPIKLIVDFTFFYKAISYGERIGVEWLGGIPNFIVVFGNLSIIGFCLLIISFSNRPKKQLFCFLIISAYFLLIMLSGRRSENVVYVCTLCFVYLKTSSKRLNIFKTIVLCFVAYFFLAFLYAIVSGRTQIGEQNIGGFLDHYANILTKSNVFLEALREYGNTGYTCVCVLSLWLKNFPPTYGVSLIQSVFSVLPNITGLAGRYSDAGNFAVQLQQNNMVTPYYTNIGGNLLGELFFNFGIVGGVIGAFVVGVLCSLVDSSISKTIQNKDFLKLMFFVPLFVTIIYWVRDVFGGGVRFTVWGIVFIFILNKITFNIEFKRNRNYEINTRDRQS